MKSFGLVLLACISFFLLARPAAAAIHPPPCDLSKEFKTDFGCIKSDPVGFVGDIYGIGLSIIGGVALLTIIYGGYLILTSSGNPSQLQSGKNAIFYALLGVLLALFGFVFVEVIAKDVLQIPGFS